jgi:acetyltransferase-like isoleucine patch superfamily enzyme
MIRWRCVIHPGANIGYPFCIQIGRGAVLGRCKISATPDPKRRYTVVIGRRAFVGDGVVLVSQGGFISLGDCASVQDYAVLYGLGGIEIGADTRVAASTVIVAHNHVFDDPSRKIRDVVATGCGIRIGEDCWIGAGARVLDGVVIGDRAVIGAGAVVTRSVDPASIAGGIPARKIKDRFGP